MEFEKLLTDFDKVSYEDWIKEAEISLHGKTFEQLYSTTDSEISLKPLYTKGDLQNLLDRKNIFPGIFPFLRGTRTLGNRLEKWKIVVDFSPPSPEKYNEMARDSIVKGQTALNLNIDVSLLNNEEDDENKPSESNNPKLSNKKFIERIGTFISSVEDFELCFKDINLYDYPLYIKADSYALMVLSLFIVYLKTQNYDLSKITGSIEFDPIAFMMQHGELNTSMNGILTEMLLIFKMSKEYLPFFKVFGMNSAYYRETGGNAVQELAYAFASAIEYIKELIRLGYNIDEIAKCFYFNFSAGPVFFTEIAKFRAARLIWAKIISEFGGNKESSKLNFSAAIINRNKSNLDAHTNILRSTSEALSAIIGGAETIITSPFDKFLKMPDDLSLRLARNLQIVLQDECELTQVCDAAGGSYYIESLTNEIAEKAWKKFTEIEKCGGMFKATIGGLPQKEILTEASKHLENLSSGKEILVGVNKYINTQEKIEINNDELLNEILEQSSRQVMKVLEKMEQPQEKPELKELYEAFAGRQENCSEAFLKAVESGAIFVELVDAVRNYEDVIKVEKLPVFRSSQIFEDKISTNQIV